MTTLSVIVQTPYILSDDDGHILAPDATIYNVTDSEVIQTYIQLGKLSDVTPEPTPEPDLIVAASDTTAEDTTSKPTTKSKARVSTQEQEISNG